MCLFSTLRILHDFNIYSCSAISAVSRVSLVRRPLDIGFVPAVTPVATLKAPLSSPSPGRSPARASLTTSTAIVSTTTVTFPSIASSRRPTTKFTSSVTPLLNIPLPTIPTVLSSSQAQLSSFSLGSASSPLLSRSGEDVSCSSLCRLVPLSNLLPVSAVPMQPVDRSKRTIRVLKWTQHVRGDGGVVQSSQVFYSTSTCWSNV